MLCIVGLGRGSSFASVALLKRIGVRPHHSGMCRIEMMLGMTNRKMEMYRVKLHVVKGTFKMDGDVSKVKKLQLMTLENPCYKKLLVKHPYLQGVVMDDKDDRARLPVHLILGNSECPRINTNNPQRFREEWDPVASCTNFKCGCSGGQVVSASVSHQ